MKKVSITVADENEFFARGKSLAALADAGKLIPIDPARVINESVRAELVEAFRQAQGERILDSVITRAGSIVSR